MAKRTGKHVTNALTPLQVTRLSTPGRHADGGGLYLEIDPTGAKRWMLRIVRRKADAHGFVVKGTRHDLGLGKVSDVTLVEARERAAELRQAAAQGQDVLAILRAGRIVAGAKPAPSAPTFAEIAEQVHKAHKASWSNGKHVENWISTVRRYAYPHLAKMPVDTVEQHHAIRCLSPIWLEKSETARRVLQRMAVIFDHAKAHGHRRGDNPMSGIEHGLPKQTDRVKHHKAMPIDEVPGFIVKLREHDAEPITRLALEWTIVSAGAKIPQ
jgi:hypothetical protein